MAERMLTGIPAQPIMPKVQSRLSPATTSGIAAANRLR